MDWVSSLSSSLIVVGASSSHLSQEPVEKEKLVEILGFVTKGICFLLYYGVLSLSPFFVFFLRLRGSRGPGRQNTIYVFAVVVLCCVVPCCVAVFCFFSLIYFLVFAAVVCCVRPLPGKTG